MRYFSTVLKAIQITLLSTAIALPLLSQNADAKFPMNVFKGVSDCLSDNKKYLSPTVGMALLDSKVIENSRFYGNFDAAYQQTKKDVSEIMPMIALVIPGGS